MNFDILGFGLPEQFPMLFGFKVRGADDEGFDPDLVTQGLPEFAESLYEEALALLAIFPGFQTAEGFDEGILPGMDNGAFHGKGNGI